MLILNTGYILWLVSCTTICCTSHNSTWSPTQVSLVTSEKKNGLPGCSYGIVNDIIMAALVVLGCVLRQRQESSSSSAPAPPGQVDKPAFMEHLDMTEDGYVISLPRLLHMFVTTQITAILHPYYHIDAECGHNTHTTIKKGCIPCPCPVKSFTLVWFC